METTISGTACDDPPLAADDPPPAADNPPSGSFSVQIQEAETVNGTNGFPDASSQDPILASVFHGSVDRPPLISAHLANLTNTTHIDVFSCKPYDPDVVAEFSRRFFAGEKVIKHVTMRH